MSTGAAGGAAVDDGGTGVSLAVNKSAWWETMHQVIMRMARKASKVHIAEVLASSASQTLALSCSRVLGQDKARTLTHQVENLGSKSHQQQRRDTCHGQHGAMI
jgi:hypothetical protein